MEIQSENNELVIRKSNQLISSKMHNNLFTNKLYAIAMTRIEQEGCKENEKLVARLYPGEIQALLGDNGNIYRELDALNQELNVDWQWVKGHAGILGNEECDRLVRMETAKYL